ncbi:LysE family translocator [Glaciibacter sp. 2TAF33]|uniref:LysE family translocator n=1 Tax=Glaciibacter sp. 2TAF33 TaxID=3233015 RepID=UPI003F93C22E
MDGTLTAAFWGVSMLFVLTPGVDWAYAIAAGRHRGGVYPAVTGMLAGHLTATLLVAAGVAAILASSEVAMTALTIAGSLYLIWLGITALRHPAATDVETRAAPVDHARLFTKGIGVSLLNPKVFLLFLALLPQFTAQAAIWPTGVQIIMLGALHVGNCAIVYFAVGHGARTILSTRPRAAKIVGILSGIVMIGLGIALVIEKALTAIH